MASENSPNLDRSLDDIIASKPKSGRRGGGAGRNSARRNIVGGPRTGGSLTRSPRSAPPAAAPAPSVPTGNKIIISNLPPDVTERDVTDLFSSTVGAVRECQINYDPNGRSKGSASVVFTRPSDATQAFNQYNNRLIDGKRTLRIEIVVDPARAPPPPTLAQRVGEPREARTTDNTRGPRREERGGRRGRGGPRRGNERPKKTAEDLDAEMAISDRTAFLTGRTMSNATSGTTVGRRLNELHTALDMAPPPISSLATDTQYSPTEDTFEDAEEGDHIAVGGTPGMIGVGHDAVVLDAPNDDGRATPTRAAHENTNGLTDGASASTPTSSPRPSGLTLEPVLSTLPTVPEPDHQREDRFSMSTSSTPDVDRFSTVPLKTPTSGTASDPFFFQETDHGLLPNLNLDLTQAIPNGVMSKLHDDEEDLGTTHAGNYGQEPMSTARTTSEEEDIRIRTDLGREREDSLRTPVAGSNPMAQGQSSAAQPLQSPSTSTKPLAEGVDLLIARLDKDKNDPVAARRSMEGREKLKEGFERLHLSPTSAAFPRSPARQVSTDTNGMNNEEKTDWVFWGEVIASYEHVARTKSEKLASAIQRGIPPALRGMVWQLMSASKDAELERVYASLLKETSPHEKAITRDLGRTFPQHAFFMDGQGIGQENLFNVLKAYSLYDKEVGYCQGLAFIGAALLLNMPDEEAFCVLVRLMYSYGSRDMYLPEMPGLQLRLYQFDRLVEELLPVLHVHFLRQGVKSSMFCSQWFLTMFSYRFPLDLVFRIFDSVFGHGIEAIFGFSIVLLIKNEEKLLKLKFDQILEYMKGELFDIYKIDPANVGEPESPGDTRVLYRADDFVQDAFGVRITPFMLDTYSNEWNELKRVQNAHAIELDNLRTTNRNLTAQVRELESALASLNKEHCEMVKQLVMGKIEREEVESELVRYKLLYAEVMHDKEDSMSSHRKSTSPTSAHAFFRMPSKVLLAARMDSIVTPGGVSGHQHNIAGGNRFSATYDYNDLLKSTCTSNLVNIDFSNYWVPGLYWVNKTDNSFTYVPSYFTIYYLDRNGSKNERVHAWPAGLRMLAGNPNRRAYDASNVADMAVSYVCLNYKSSSPQGVKFPPNQCPDGLRAQIVFPSCWDGKNLDSPDHMSHLAYPIDGHPDSGNCPSTHPVRLVTLFYEQVFKVGDLPYNGPGTWVLSNGDDTGYGYHGDFVNGWPAGDNSLLQQAIDQCTSLSGELNDCPILRPYLDNAAKEACQPVTQMPNEDVGYRGNGVAGGKVTTIPGCNPIWTGTGPKPTCSTPPATPAYVTVQSKLPAGWTVSKCMTDNAGKRALSGASLVDPVGMTQAKCATFCESKGFKLAGVEWRQECYCGNALDASSVEAPDSQCGRNCSGEPYENCGGDAHITLLVKNGAANANPVPVTSTAKPSSSVVAVTSAKASSSAKPSSTTVAPVVKPTLPAVKLVSSPKPIGTSSKPTPSSKPATVPTPPTSVTWKYQGCLSEPLPHPHRALTAVSMSDSKLTIEKCTAFCTSKGYSLAGMEYSTECFCDNKLQNGASLSQFGKGARCLSTCAGNIKQQCGSAWTLSLYSSSNFHARSVEVDKSETSGLRRHRRQQSRASHHLV
ncbi:GTPase-activating protein [Tulasnella sp. 403]|nr:GTPase-activating protein [Tulasnella sp. 403]